MKLLNPFGAIRGTTYQVRFALYCQTGEATTRTCPRRLVLLFVKKNRGRVSRVRRERGRESNGNKGQQVKIR
jgi:hypothetical protein